jgi:sugar transferase (PEP-CTERM system associated)
MFFYLCFWLAAILLFDYSAFYKKDWLYLKILIITSVCQVCLYYNNLYNLKEKFEYKKLYIHLFKAIGFSAILLWSINIVFQVSIITFSFFMMGTLLIAALVVSFRLCYSVVLCHGLFNKRILLLGSGDLKKKICEEIDRRKDCGYSVIKEIPECIDEVNLDQPSCVPLTGVNFYKGLAETCRQLGIHKIVVSFRENRNQFPIRELLRCRVEGIDVVEGNTFYELLTGKLQVEYINPGWLIFSSGFEKSKFRRFSKRLFDLVVSITMMILTLPLFLLAAVLIKLDSPGPVIFSQARVGERNRIYRMYKFRSMVRDAEKLTGPVWAEEKDSRITRVGRVMRRLRIDELPQLWNVIEGSMSFVGPRPEREVFVNELEKIVPYYRERFTVKPGITGWAQVKYGYGASVADAIEKLSFDLFYIKNMSLGLDILVFILTIKVVLFRHGAR